MPRSLAFSEPERVGRVSGTPAPSTRGVLFALLAVGLTAMVSASTAHYAQFAAPTTSEAAAAMPDVALRHARADQGPRSGIARIDAEIDAVAEAIARKYRISQTATREFVSTAYREGSGIGVDPLLIVAVMAIESRFNPIAQSEGGAIGLMQVIPRYHADKFDLARGASVLEPHANIRLGARVLKEYIRRGGTDAAGLQLYNGASADASNAYASKVLGERQRLRETARRSREARRA
jgi:soluble lytic murein transglycosylase-like protein